MASSLVTLLVVVVIVALVVWLVLRVLDLLPLGAFAPIARGLVFIIAAVIILLRALPLINSAL